MTSFLFDKWLKDCLPSMDYTVTPLAGDASFRRYFRVKQADRTFVLMDASAEKEKCPAFVSIAEALRAKELCAPKVYAHDFSNGFLLLSDLGDELLLKKLTPDNAAIFYSRALDVLAVLSTCCDVKGYVVPSFTVEFMRDEMQLFQTWFLEKHLGLVLTPSLKEMLASAFDVLVRACSLQPTVFMHRDFHSANLMVLPDYHIGILDFQDAFIGPLTYDLVSLLRDCYIDFPREWIMQWALSYRDRLALSVDDKTFLEWFDWMGMQRHLKALLTFSRKYRRDNNDQYLKHIPRTLNYVLDVSERYPVFHALHAFLKKEVLEKIICVE